MKTWLMAGLGVVLLAGAGYGVQRAGVDVAGFLGLRSAPQSSRTEAKPGSGQKPGSRGAVPVEIALAAATQVSDDIMAIGTLLSAESAAISPETSGRVAAINFKDGGRVAEGAALFTLDAELAEAALADAQARLVLAEANFGRSQTLQKSGNVARSALDAVVAELQVARAAVASAQLQIKKLTITAPFAGHLGFRNVSVGAFVQPGTDLVRLDKIDLLKVSFSLPELEQARIATGQLVEVTADALPGETFNATISAIDPVVDAGGRALRVRADLENSALKLRPGFLVRITARGNQRQAVMVPEAALVQRGDNSFVYVVDNKTASEAKVEIGKRMPGTIEILHGVTAGAEVIVAGNTRLSNGAAIEVVAAQKPVN